MIARHAPSQFVIRNGKLQPRTQPQTNTENYRVITYDHTVRVMSDDYATATIKQQKKQIEELKKNYAELQQAYWHLLGANTQTPDTDSFKKQDITLNTTLQISQFNMNPKSEYSRLATEGQILNELQEAKCHLNHLNESTISYLTEQSSKSLKADQQQQVIDDNEVFFEEQLHEACEEIERLKQQLEEATENHYQVKKIKEQKQQLEETTQKLGDILEREKKNSRMLNQMISRMRNDLSNRDKLIIEIYQLKKIDKATITQLSKKYGASKLF